MRRNAGGNVIFTVKLVRMDIFRQYHKRVVDIGDHDKPANDIRADYPYNSGHYSELNLSICGCC